MTPTSTHAGETAAQRTVLHVGCGQRPRAIGTGLFAPALWSEVRLDIDTSVTPDSVGDMRELANVATASMDAVWSAHVLDQVDETGVEGALAQFRRVLRPQGVLIIVAPDLQTIGAALARDTPDATLSVRNGKALRAIDALYGHADAHKRTNHKATRRSGFTARTLAATLERAGFARITVRRTEWELYASAHRAPGDAAGAHT